MTQKRASAPTLTDGVVMLAALAPGDVQPYIDCWDAEVKARMRRPPPENVDQALAMIESRNAAWASGGELRTWAIRRAADRKFCGWTTLMLLQVGALVEIWICGEWRGQKLAPRAMKLLIDYSFHRLGLPLLAAEIDRDNTNAAKVAEALGFSVDDYATVGDRIVDYWRLHRQQWPIAGTFVSDK